MSRVGLSRVGYGTEFPIGFSFNKRTQIAQDSRIFKSYYLPIEYIFSVDFMLYHIDIIS